MLRESYSTFVKGLGLVLLILIGWLAPILFFNEEADSRILDLNERGQWMIHAGDLAFDGEGRPVADESGWRPAANGLKEESLSGPGYYWLQLQLHTQGWRDPHLFVHDLKHYEIYWDGLRLFEFNFEERNRLMLEYYEWNLVSLPFGYGNDPLLFRVYSDDGKIKPGIVHAGNATDFLLRILHRDGDKLLYSIIFASLFIVSALLFFSTKRKMYFYFGLLTFCGGYAALCRTFAMGLFFDAPMLIYVHELMLPLGTFAFHGFFDQMFPTIRSRRRLFIRRGMLSFTLLCFLVSLWSTHAFHALIYKVFPFFFVIMVTSSLVSLYRIYRAQRTTESVVMLLGYLSSVSTTLLSCVLFVYPELRDRLMRPFPWLSPYLREDQLPLFVGIFVFLCCLGAIILIRENRVHEQVRVYAREVEDKNKKLEAMDKLKDDFLANTSHELRTPLNGIIGITQSLLDGAAGPLNEPIRGNLSMVVSSGKRLSSLINDILDFSKLKHSGISLAPRNVDLARTAELVVNVLRPLAVMKDIRLVNALDEKLPLVKADENRIQQILYNLIGNALKFSDGGEVRLSAREDGDRLSVSVSDSGIGIPADKLGAIFEPFEQGQGSASREYEGAGLGLAITKKLVDLHGGVLDVRSVPGEGSTFTFTLPVSDDADYDRANFGAADENRNESDEEALAGMLRASRWLPSVPRESGRFLDAESDESANPSAGPGSSAGPGAGVRKAPVLLLVDDDPVNLRVLSNFLQGEPYRIVQAESGSEALGHLDRGLKPDLIVTDLMMPRMTGYELCRAIRNRYTASELPVLLLTAKNQPEDLVAGFDTGANDYLTKPVEKRELLARIALHLELSGLSRDLEWKVRERTLALEETNLQLQASMQETAEALAEASVLEERNRIAFDIHNTVGHSLTASIVQMEAAKMLIARDRMEQALSKLDIARELVGKGLNDIRGTVRLLKQESTDEDLAQSLERLLRETEQTAGVRVDRTIGSLPALGSSQKRALFHALMEGLTNGIRHGRCTRFDFALETKDGRILFRLANDGKAYEPGFFGFGLSAMQENVKRLGGHLSMDAGDGGGSVLSIELPLDWRAQSRFLETASGNK